MTQELNTSTELNASAIEIGDAELWKDYVRISAGQERLLEEYDQVYKTCDTDRAKIAVFNEYDEKLKQSMQNAKDAYEKWRNSFIKVYKVPPEDQVYS